MLVVLFGPSGVGKTSLMRILVRKHGYQILHTYTTRPPRYLDDDRKSLPEDEFNKLEQAGEIFSTSTVFGHRYGAHRQELEDALSRPDARYVIDFALENWQDITSFGGTVVGVLILPPSEQELKRRLHAQKREARIEDSMRQLAFCLDIRDAGLPHVVGDRVLVNDVLPATAERIHRFVAGHESDVGRGTDTTSVPSGPMTDYEILDAMQAGRIFERGTWEIKQVHQASYGLRLDSDAMVSVAEVESLQGQREYKVVDSRSGNHLELRPGDSALLYTVEHFHLPPNIVGITFPRGLLVAQSLAPGASYVDPGFSGRFCVPVTNTSSRIVRLPADIEIARVLFFRLDGGVSTPWTAADATSLKTALEALPGKVATAPEQVKAMSTSQLVAALKASQSGPELIELTARLRRLLVFLTALCVVWPVMLHIFNSGAMQAILGGMISGVSSGFVGNVIAGLVTAIIASVAAVVSRSLRKRPANLTDR